MVTRHRIKAKHKGYLALFVIVGLFVLAGVFWFSTHHQLNYNGDAVITDKHSSTYRFSTSYYFTLAGVGDVGVDSSTYDRYAVGQIYDFKGTVWLSTLPYF
jgi:hypothetical protein